MSSLLVGAFLLSLNNCATTEKEKVEIGKIPITTTSELALKSFMQGRELSEKLRGQESLIYFEKAIAEDHDFAMAYLYLAQFSPSAKAFFENLDQAVALADKVSEGERLWILGVQAGANGLPMKQREYYTKLVEAFPQDERAHNLLGINYFVQQEWEKAIEECTKAIEIAPEFSLPYNQLGYAHRFLANYTEAENAFKKYIELIPDDPNPYDSYAELLMKMGKFEESIDYYKKALAQNPNFVASHIGIATNLNFLGKHEQAREQLGKLYSIARNDGERRAAHFAKTVSYVDEGDMEKALEELQDQFTLAERINDEAAMAGDLVAMGNILLEKGEPDEAMAKYEKSLKIMTDSNLSQEIKDNAKRGFLYNAARVMMYKEQFSTAKTNADEFLKEVKAINNPNQVRLAHELAGMIALAEEDYEKAIEELYQANLQNPYNLYRISLAYEGKGEKDKAREYCEKAAEFNALNSLNYAYIRAKAHEMLSSM